jgi:hypothetical protein
MATRYGCNQQQIETCSNVEDNDNSYVYYNQVVRHENIVWRGLLNFIENRFVIYGFLTSEIT